MWPVGQNEGRVPDYWCQFRLEGFIEAVQWEEPSQGQQFAEWTGGRFDPAGTGGVGPDAEQWGELIIPTRGGFLTASPYDYVVRQGPETYFLKRPQNFESPVLEEMPLADSAYERLAQSTAWVRRRRIREEFEKQCEIANTEAGNGFP